MDSIIIENIRCKMADYIVLKNGSQCQQIVIQDGEKEDIDVEEMLENCKGDNEEMETLKWPEGLRINKQRLFRYGVLEEKRMNTAQSTLKVKLPGRIETKKEAEAGRDKQSGSIKSIKSVKHKIIPCSGRLKTTYTDKQNMQPMLPKVGGRLKREGNILNKTTSAISFNSRDDLLLRQQTKQAEQKLFDARYVNQVSSAQDKSSQRDSKLQLKSSRSGSVLRKTLGKASSQFKIKMFGKTSNNSQVHCDKTEIASALAKINQKQSLLVEERRMLQNRVQLRGDIQKENVRLDEVLKNKQRLASLLNQKEQQSKHSRDGAKLSKRKNENYQIEASEMQNRLSELNMANDKYLQSIAEQKELIRMYESVIEELREQMKVEKQAKQELQNSLAVMKKNLKWLETKALSHQASNKQVFRKIYVSLQKWQ